MTQPRDELTEAAMTEFEIACYRFATTFPGEDTVEPLKQAQSALRTRITEKDSEIARLAAGHDEYNRVNRMIEAENDRLREISGAGYAAHAASFGALMEISHLTDLEGEVGDYSDVVKAVERLRGITLPPEEAVHILHGSYFAGNRTCARCQAIDAKLRKIAEEGKPQTVAHWDGTLYERVEEGK